MWTTTVYNNREAILKQAKSFAVSLIKDDENKVIANVLKETLEDLDYEDDTVPLLIGCVALMNQSGGFITKMFRVYSGSKNPANDNSILSITNEEINDEENSDESTEQKQTIEVTNKLAFLHISEDLGTVSDFYVKYCEDNKGDSKARLDLKIAIFNYLTVFYQGKDLVAFQVVSRTINNEATSNYDQYCYYNDIIINPTVESVYYDKYTVTDELFSMDNET